MIVPAFMAVRSGAYGVAVAVLLGLGLWGGCHWQASRVERAQRAQAQAEHDAAGWKRAAEGWQRATVLFQRRYAADEKAARARAQAAERASRARAAEQAKADRELADWQRRFDALTRTPDCAALAKETTCAIFRSY